MPLAGGAGIARSTWPSGELKVRLCGRDPETGSPAIWLEVDDSQPEGEREILAFVTGADIPDGWGHVGSAICGPYVWHVYADCSADVGRGLRP